MRRLRLTTLILLVIVLGQSIALVIQEQKANRRMALLHSALSLYRNRAEEEIVQKLEKEIQFVDRTGGTLHDFLKQVRLRTWGTWLPSGIPIWADPDGLREAGVELDAPFSPGKPFEMAPLGDQLRELLKPHGLTYQIDGGLMIITSETALEKARMHPKGGSMQQQDTFRKYREVLE